VQNPIEIRIKQRPDFLQKIGVAIYVTHKGWVGGDTPSATGGSVYLAPLVRRLEPADILETRFSSGAHSALVSERTPRAEPPRVKE